MDLSRTLSLHEFEVLFNNNHRFLCMIALKYVSDPAVAEDVVQEFFVSFWERRHTLKLQQSFEAYACRSVKNLSISWLRKSASANRRLEGYQLPEVSETEEDILLDETREAFEMRVLKLIDELPPGRRKIFLLSTQGDRSYKQIAAELGISINTVKTQIVKAYASLRDKAGPVCFGLNIIFWFNAS